MPGLCQACARLGRVWHTLCAVLATIGNLWMNLGGMTGLITACALVRPSKSVMDITPKSVRKKWKQKGFAAGADRGVIERGAQMLGIEINELISDVIMGMRQVAPEIGLG